MIVQQHAVPAPATSGAHQQVPSPDHKALLHDHLSRLAAAEMEAAQSDRLTELVKLLELRTKTVEMLINR